VSTPKLSVIFVSKCELHVFMQVYSQYNIHCNMVSLFYEITFIFCKFFPLRVFYLFDVTSTSELELQLKFSNTTISLFFF